MESVVIRHGRSIVDTSGKVNARDFGACAKEYNDSKMIWVRGKAL